MAVTVLVLVLILFSACFAQVCHDETVTPFQVLLPEGSDLINTNMGHYTSIYEDTIVAGAYGHKGWRGALYVYEKGVDGSFSFGQKLEASHPHGGSYLGLNIDMSKDTIVGGSPFSRPLEFVKSGSVYVWERDGSGIWSETAKLVPYDAQENGFFGYAVAIDKNTLIVGARTTYNEINEISRAGKVYIYEREGSNWSLSQMLRGNKPGGIQWADEVRIVDDVLCLGAPRDYDGEGSAFVYTKVNGKWAFGQEFRLIEDSENGVIKNGRDHFGEGIAISEDAQVIAIGGETMNSVAGTRTGAAQVYGRSGKSWVFKQFLYPTTWGGLAFGQRIAIRNNIIAIGAWKSSEGVLHAGSTYLYKKCDDGSYVVQEKILHANRMEKDSFGKHVDLSDEYLIVGANKDNDVGFSASGAVHVYRLGSAPTAFPVPTAPPSATTSLPILPPATPTSTPSATPTPIPTQTHTPTPTSNNNLTPLPTPTQPSIPLEDSLAFVSDVSVLKVGQNLITIAFQSKEPGRVLHLRIKNKITNQRMAAGIVPIPQGSSTHTFSVHLYGSPGFLIQLRAAMWPEGTSWKSKVIRGVFVDSTLTTKQASRHLAESKL